MAKNIALESAINYTSFNNAILNYFRLNSNNSNIDNKPTEEDIQNAIIYIYSQLQKNVINKCEKIKDYAHITLQPWCDNNKKISYLTIGCHYLDENWNFNYLTLSTILLPMISSLTLKEIQKEIIRIIKKFKIDKRNKSFTTYSGGYVVDAIMNIKYPAKGKQFIDCLGFKCHNLLSFNACDNSYIQSKFDLLIKIQHIQIFLMCKYKDLDLETKMLDTTKILFKAFQDMGRFYYNFAIQIDYVHIYNGI